MFFQRGEGSCAAEKIKCFGRKGVDTCSQVFVLPSPSDLPRCQAAAGSGSSLLPSTCAQKLSEESTKRSKAEESSHFPGVLSSRC